jgi:hypothetical protein
MKPPKRKQKAGEREEKEEWDKEEWDDDEEE